MTKAIQFELHVHVCETAYGVATRDGWLWCRSKTGLVERLRFAFGRPVEFSSARLTSRYIEGRVTE